MEQQLQQAEACQAGSRQQWNGVEHVVSVRGPGRVLIRRTQEKQLQEVQVLTPADTFQDEAG